MSDKVQSATSVLWNYMNPNSQLIHTALSKIVYAIQSILYFRVNPYSSVWGGVYSPIIVLSLVQVQCNHELILTVTDGVSHLKWAKIRHSDVPLPWRRLYIWDFAISRYTTLKKSYSQACNFLVEKCHLQAQKISRLS